MNLTVVAVDFLLENNVACDTYREVEVRNHSATKFSQQVSFGLSPAIRLTAHLCCVNTSQTGVPYVRYGCTNS
jgi:hypothetical protein